MAFVTLATVKQYLQINHDEEDDALEIKIEEAQEFIEKETGLYFHDGDGSSVESIDGGTLFLRPTRLPINSVSKIEDTENSDEIQDADDYKYTKWKIMWDQVDVVWGDGYQRWKVTFDAGYGPSTIPAGIKGLILELVYRWYWGRGDRSQQSAAGYGYDFETYMDGMLRKRINKYSMKLGIS